LLGLKIVCQRFLASIEFVSNVSQVIASCTIVDLDTGVMDIGVSVDGFHDLLESLISFSEFLGLIWQLHLDIIRREDVLKILPLGLNLKPEVLDIGDGIQVLLPLGDSGLDGSDVFGGREGLEDQDVIF
jgi:hypothetical protein